VYDKESAALAFLRDVAPLCSREPAKTAYGGAHGQEQEKAALEAVERVVGLLRQIGERYEKSPAQGAIACLLAQADSTELIRSSDAARDPVPSGPA
jgi:hypothetical protein